MDSPADSDAPAPCDPSTTAVPTVEPAAEPAPAAPVPPAPEHKPTDVKGYRALAPQELAVINALKAKGEELESLLRSARLLGGLRDYAEADECCRTAKTNFRQGFMWAVRAITQPSTFA